MPDQQARSWLGAGLSVRRVLISVVLIGSCVGCDQGTKRLAEQSLKGQPTVRLLNGLVQFYYETNQGAWGSLGAHWPPLARQLVLVLVPLAVLGAITVHMLRAPVIGSWKLVAFALVVGGGAGNIIDRLTAGYVVDFIWVGTAFIGTNVFNVADVAVMAGVIMLILPERRRPVAEG